MATSPTPASHSHSSEKPRQDPGKPRGTKSLSGSRADSGTRSCLRQVAEFLPSQADHPSMLPTLLTAARPYPNDLPESETPRSLPGPEDPARGHVAHAPSRLATSPRSKRHFVIPGYAPISPASVPDLGSNLALTTLPLRRSPHQLCALATHLLSLPRACTRTCPRLCPPPAPPCLLRPSEQQGTPTRKDQAPTFEARLCVPTTSGPYFPFRATSPVRHYSAACLSSCGHSSTLQPVCASERSSFHIPVIIQSQLFCLPYLPPLGPRPYSA